MSRKFRTARVGLAVTVTGTMALGLAVAAGAQGSSSPTINEATSCRASVLRVGSGEPFVANPNDAPCATDFAGISKDFTLGPVDSSGEVFAKTSDSPNAPFVTLSKAKVADVRIKSDVPHFPALRVQAANSRAGVKCTKKGNPRLIGRSRIGAIRLSTTHIQGIRDQTEINLAPLAIIWFNHQIVEDNSLTQRAVEVDFGADGSPDVVVGEAQADYTSDPCSEPTS